MKLCGSCRYHDPQRRICAINMAYQAFVYVDTPTDPLYFMGVQVVNQP